MGQKLEVLLAATKQPAGGEKLDQTLGSNTCDAVLARSTSLRNFLLLKALNLNNKT